MRDDDVRARDFSFGAQWLGGGRTRFRLWAPALKRVSVEFDDGRCEALRRLPGGWFERTLDARPGARYRYRLPDGRVVPDPASRAQADDVHGWSVVVDPGAYRWINAQWRGRPWHETVIYELHVGCVGGFEAVSERLPALAALGVTAIELMPVATFPGQRNWGYDGVLPFAPHRGYGSLDDLRALVDRAHGLNLMVFLDVVYNHFGPDGNYLQAYAPKFFREDRPTLWGPAIDFRRPEVRAFFTANARYWLEEFRFDGLRLDAVHAIGDPGWLDEMAAEVRTSIEPEREIYLVLENDDNDAARLVRAPGCGFDAQWNDDAHHALHVMLTGESEGYYAAYFEAPAVQLARCLAEGFAFQGEFSPVHGGQRGTVSTALPPSAFVMFLQNHDQIGNRAFGERLSVLAEPEALRAATALLLLSPHIPLLFMGDEWGTRDPFLFFTDHHSELAAQVREGRRKEFARFAAFSDPARRAQIPDPNAPETFLRSQPQPPDDAPSRVEEMRTLLRLRLARIAPGIPGARSLGAEAIGEAAVQASWLLSNGLKLTLAMNLASDPVPFAAPRSTPIHVSRRDHDPHASLLSGACTVAWLA